MQVLKLSDSTIHHTASIDINYGATVGNVKEFLENFPDAAKVIIKTSPYYNQFDPGYTKIEVSWYD